MTIEAEEDAVKVDNDDDTSQETIKAGDDGISCVRGPDY